MRGAPPSIRHLNGVTAIRFPPQLQWGFVNAQSYELTVEGEPQAGLLRHVHAQLSDARAYLSYKDLERIFQARLERSAFTEIHIECAPSNPLQGRAPLIIWGIYEPSEQRPTPFYLEGGFHAFPHGVRFELYTGVLFGRSEVNANTLAAQLLRESGLPVQRTHPTVVNFDPLTELSIAYCLDWGWKLPRRRIECSIQLQESEISFVAGRSLDEQSPEQVELNRGIIRAQQKQLDHLKIFHEGEGLLHAGEHESAKIFFKTHEDHPKGAARYFELRHWLEGPSLQLQQWVQSSALCPSDQARAHALIAEAEGHPTLAAREWKRFIHAEKEGHRHPSAFAERSPHALRLLEGLVEINQGLLLMNQHPEEALSHFEVARRMLPASLRLLGLCAQVATRLEDRHLAQARLTEKAQRLLDQKDPTAASNAWVQIGDLWHLDQDTFGNAERAYQRAIEISPTYLTPYYQLSALQQRRGDLIAARAILERILELSPFATEARNRLTQLSYAPAPSRPPSGRTTQASILPIREAATLLPRPSEEDLKPVSSLPPAPSSPLEGDPTPPPRPLSAAPMAHSDPWSLSPQDRVGDWLTAQENLHTPIAQVVRSPQASEASTNPPQPSATPQSSAATSSRKVTAKPTPAPAELLPGAEQPTPAPQRQAPPQSVSTNQPAQQQSERVMKPTPTIEEIKPQRGLESPLLEEAKSIPAPPRGRRGERKTWSAEDFEALNNALQLPTPSDPPPSPIEAPTKPPARITAQPEDRSPPPSLSSESAASQGQPSHRSSRQTLPRAMSNRVTVPTPVIRDEDAKELKPVQKIQPDALTENEIITALKHHQEIARSSVHQFATRSRSALKIATLYRDHKLDLQLAKEWLWEGLKLSVDDEVRTELCESLTEIFTSEQDWNGLLEFHTYVAQQSWGDVAQAELQRASLLRGLGQTAEALIACERAQDAYGPISSHTRRQTRELHERVLRLSAELHVELNDPVKAAQLLTSDLPTRDIELNAARKSIAARYLVERDPAKASELFAGAFEDSPTRDRLDEWLSHVNHWGDPHGRAQASRAYAADLRDDPELAHRAPRILSNLANDLHQDAPLLALELYFESIEIQSDPEVMERALEVARMHNQNHAQLQVLELLIPECFEGEYRGQLKLNRALALAATRNQHAEEVFLDALSELIPPLDEPEVVWELLNWAETQLPRDRFEIYLEIIVETLQLSLST